MKVCIIGASGKLGRHLVQHSLDKDHEVVCVCREHIWKLDKFKGPGKGTQERGKIYFSQARPGAVE